MTRLCPLSPLLLSLLRPPPFPPLGSGPPLGFPGEVRFARSRPSGRVPRPSAPLLLHSLCCPFCRPPQGLLWQQVYPFVFHLGPRATGDPLRRAFSPSCPIAESRGLPPGNTGIGPLVLRSLSIPTRPFPLRAKPFLFLLLFSYFYFVLWFYCFYCFYIFLIFILVYGFYCVCLFYIFLIFILVYGLYVH